MLIYCLEDERLPVLSLFFPQSCSKFYFIARWRPIEGVFVCFQRASRQMLFEQ